MSENEVDTNRMCYCVLNNILNISDNSSQETEVAKLSKYVMPLARMYFYTLSNELPRYRARSESATRPYEHKAAYFAY